MANWYDKALTRIGRALLDLDGATTLKIIPVTSGYVFDANDEFLSDITPSERVSAAIALLNVSFGAGTAAAGGSGPTNPVHRWTMDDADLSGIQCLDTGSSPVHMDLLGAPSTGLTGQINQGIFFDEFQGQAGLADESAVNTLTHFTWIAWFNNSYPSQRAQPIMDASGRDGSGFYNGVSLGLDPTGLLSCSIADGLGQVQNVNIVGVDSLVSVKDGVNHLAGITYNFTTGDFKLWSDGVVQGTANLAAAVSWLAGINLTINGILSGFPLGQTRVDDAQIFNYEFTPTQMIDTYNNAGYAVGLGVNEGWLDADDFIISSPTPADTIVGFVVYEDTGVEATSPVLFYADSGLGLPYVVASAADISVQLSNNGLAKL